MCPRGLVLNYFDHLFTLLQLARERAKRPCSTTPKVLPNMHNVRKLGRLNKKIESMVGLAIVVVVVYEVYFLSGLNETQKDT